MCFANDGMQISKHIRDEKHTCGWNTAICCGGRCNCCAAKILINLYGIDRRAQRRKSVLVWFRKKIIFWIHFHVADSETCHCVRPMEVHGTPLSSTHGQYYDEAYFPKVKQTKTLYDFRRSKEFASVIQIWWQRLNFLLSKENYRNFGWFVIVFLICRC